MKKGATISCVGAYQHHMQEMDPAILPRASKIYFDSEDAVLSESGDILIPLEEGIITKEDFTGDLGDVIKGNVVGRENDEEIIVFETVGVATQDLVPSNTGFEDGVTVIRRSASSMAASEDSTATMFVPYAFSSSCIFAANSFVRSKFRSNT